MITVFALWFVEFLLFICMCHDQVIIYKHIYEADPSVPVSTLCYSTPHLSSGILPPTDYETTIKSLHTRAVTISKTFLSHNRVLQTASPQISPEEAKLPRSYKSTLPQIRSSFCSSLHSYGERIGLVPGPLCLSCGLVPHTTVHVFSCSSHPTPLTELDPWERLRLASEFLSSLPFFNLPLLLPPPSELPPSSGQES